MHPVHSPDPRRPGWLTGLAALGATIGLILALAPQWFDGTGCDGDSLCPIGQGLRRGHDTAFHAVTTRAVARSLEARSGAPLLPASILPEVGPRYPEWVDSIQGGLGGPVFAIYPPVATFATAALERALSLDTTVALRTGATLAVLLAFTSFVGAGRWIGASPAGAVLGATLYAAGPHVLTDLHLRFALATLWAYAWLPWIVVGSLRLLRRPDWVAWIVTVVATAGLWCTHVISGILLAAACAPALVAAVWFSIQSRRSSRQGHTPFAGPIRWIGAIAVSLPLAAVFLLPMIASRGAVELEWIQNSGHGDFRRNFLFLDERAADFSQAALKPWMESLAMAQLSGGLVLVALIFWRPIATTADRTVQRRALAGGATMVWIFLLQTPLSWPVWRLTPLAWAQFPWRLAGLQGLLLGLLVAHVLSAGRRAGIRSAAPLLVAAAVLVFGLVSVRPFDVGLRDGAEEIDRRSAELWVPEYLPAGWLEGHEPMPGQELPWELEAGEATTLEQSPGRWHLLLNAPTPTHFVGPFAFPGMSARLDGVTADTAADEDQRLVVAVPAGRHELELRYRTPWRRTGFWISVLTLLALYPSSRFIVLSRTSRSRAAT